MRDKGSRTPYLYRLYLTSKVALITKLIRQDDRSNIIEDYELLVWADTIIKIIKMYNITIEDLDSSGVGDTKFIAILLKKYRLTFCSSVFYKYKEVLVEE